jgi:succinoglycan biosynthesis protein ExoM
MREGASHISVCICTYKRPDLLKRLLRELTCLQTEGLFTYSIVVADNDALQSAKRVVLEFAAVFPLRIRYCVEPLQNIALARNRAIENATGQYIAFIDDDEFPTSSWLLALFRACQAFGVDGALGPVRPHFDEDPPEWVVRGKFYDRPTYPTGLVIDWRKGRTGNLLLRRAILTPGEPAFRSEFLTGEDQDFFSRMIPKGHTFVWCNEAVAYETVPPARWRLSFMLRRALLRGKISAREPGCGFQAIAKSWLAVVVYLAALPFILVAGWHLFVSYLVKICDHLGRILGALGFDPIKKSYVTE